MYRSSSIICIKLMCLVAGAVLLLNNCAYKRDKFKADDSTESYNARVEINYANVEKDISPFLYGNNTKWLLGGEAGTGRDDGIWSTQDNDINKNIRKWLVDSGITILRYGDGGNADYFYWGWSILPFKERMDTPVRTRWSNTDYYIFGVMEFIKLCDAMKSEGIVIVNFNMGVSNSFYDPANHKDSRTKMEIGIQQAANWVEFMNIPAPAQKEPSFPDKYKPEYSLQKMPKGYFAYLRAQLGHPEPARIKNWEIGNEVNIFHDLDDYVTSAIEYGKAMKAVDPSIKIGWVDYGSMEQLELAAKVPEVVDFLASHDYVKWDREIPFYGTQVVKRKINVLKEGNYLIRFKAFGRAYFGSKYPEEVAVAPVMELRVDDRIIKNITIDKNIKNNKSDLTTDSFWYEVPIMLSPGPHNVSLKMINDFIDRSFADINRRGRDVFVTSWMVERKGEQYDILFPKDDVHALEPPYLYYALINDFNLRLHNRQALISKYAPWLFVAQTESGFLPAGGTIWAALGEAMMIMADMKHDVKFRNLWHLYGTCNRFGVIHSGKRNQENYHVTPEYYVNKMFSQHFGSKMISASVFSAQECRGENGVKKLTEGVSFPFQDCVRVIASRDREKVYIAIVNLHTSKNAALDIELKNFRVGEIMQYTLRAKKPKEFDATNEDVKDNVFIQSIRESKTENISYVPPNSFSIIEYSKDVSD